MATKPTPLPEWSTNATFPASVFPADLPWAGAAGGSEPDTEMAQWIADVSAGLGLAAPADFLAAPHPNAGAATPWSGQSVEDATNINTLAAAGHEPGKPTPAETWNAWLRRLSKWVKWVEDGRATVGGNPHLVETDAFGDTVLAGLSLVEGPWSRFSHENAEAWDQSFKVKHRTFAQSGTISAAAFKLFDLTRPNNAADDRYFFADFPDHCVVMFHLDALVYAGDGFALADNLAILGRRSQFYATKAAGVWTGAVAGPGLDDYKSGLGLAVLPSTSGDTSRLHMRWQGDAGLVGFDYRIVVDCSVRVLEITG